MKRGIITALAVLAAWWGGANFASAQIGGSFTPLGGGTVRTRPFGPVQMQPINPQIAEMQQSLNRLNPDGSLRGQIDAAGGNVNALGGLQTGHATTFFNTGHYFPTTPAGGTGSGGQALGTGVGGLNPTFTGGVGGFGFGSGGVLTTSPFSTGTFGAGRPGIR